MKKSFINRCISATYDSHEYVGWVEIDFYDGETFIVLKNRQPGKRILEFMKIQFGSHKKGFRYFR